MNKATYTVIGGVIMTVLTGILICLLTGVFTYWLWNWLMPSIFGLKALTWLQAWGLTVLSNILFKSWVGR